MNIQSLQNFRDFLVQPLLKGVLENRFKPGEMIQGKIIQALPKQNLFVLKVKGMNLVATTRLSLFAGDRIAGQIINNREQIELKLTEVNGKSVQQNIQIKGDGVTFTHLSLAEELFGKRSFLEIYPDREGDNPQQESFSGSNYHIIFFSPDLQYVVLDLNFFRGELTATLWIENSSLYQFIDSNLPEIEQVLMDDVINQAKLRLNPFQGEISHFRRQWTEALNFDIRA